MKSRKLLKSRRHLTRRKTQSGGAVSKLPPLPSGKTWDLKYLGGHGGLTGNAFLVPDNTYILNLATAGRPCLKEGLSIENTLFDQFGATFGKKSPQKILEDSLASGSFLKSTNAEYLYNEGSSGVNEAYGTGKKTEKTIAFYEPGDIMLDNQLSIYNDSLPYYIFGLYNVVVPNKVVNSFFDDEVVAARDAEFNDVFKAKYGTTPPIPPPTENELAKLYAPLYKEHHKKLLNIPENLLQSEMFDAAGNAIRKEFTIREVLKIMGAVPADKIRVLFVKACRGAPRYSGNNDTKIKERAEAMRRFSLASRQRFESVPGAVGGGSVVASSTGTAAASSTGTAAAVGGGKASTTGGASAAASSTTSACKPLQRLRISALEEYFQKAQSYAQKHSDPAVIHAHTILGLIIANLKLNKLIDFNQLVSTLKILNSAVGGATRLCSVL